jgi:pyruvate/2-oxoglutarate dehydrogenase complex dihydrolipoamide acyltransferase (E2) component
MPEPLRIPRINNNDDQVRVAAVRVTPGAFVQAGETVLEVESDKAVITVEAETGGHVLRVLVAEGATVDVGSIALWLGASADEPIPGEAGGEVGRAGNGAALPEPGGAEPTLKARLLLARYGLAAGVVARSGGRLTATDIEAHVAAHGLAPVAAVAPAPPPRAVVLPAAADETPMLPAQRGMLAAVTWQRDHAAAAYLEIGFDPEPWDRFAAAFAKANRLLFSPLLSLMAWRLAVLAREMPEINATVIEAPTGPRLASYASVNLGFTVQAGETLYLVVAHDASGMEAAAFVARLAELQRRTIARKLEPAELQGATIGFSSMARWELGRHIPVLAPWTAAMVAHTVSSIGGVRQGVLGVTYDHRVLSGFAAARLLRAVATVPATPEA